ncbi:bifunctional DNA primase/polymerase [Streptomyces sp. K1PN6]|uniref:Bifunctional DNA primase/polymerase n=1 Tax=Streptomyces acidicola TaxID=2596892 RepID=A0A5N8X4A6_9ACTN|nr:bifunctional DNA primase/polymerase [Streptomyces acidicola]MPY54122.1 bifunctional DNA primase/polymerase [Streptomyces acidicola]
MFIVEETIAGPEAAQIPMQRGESLLEAAVRYAEERHWDVCPGTWLEAADGEHHCSCGQPACAVPGAHPAREDWASQATGSATVARRLWSQQPTASILLPTGLTFDVIDVPETAGLLALARMERMDLTLGPVAWTPDRRMQFFVLPGASAKIPDLVRKLGWSPLSLDLTALGEGAYVTAPPTRYGSRGAVQWARRPTPANRWLPDAEELISPLTYACGRDGRR